NPTRLEWGQLLSQFDVELKRQREPDPITLLVDAAGLDRVGISPRTLITVDAIESPSQRAAALLAEAGLTLVVDANTVVVTTAVEAAIHADQYVPVTQSICQLVPQSSPPSARQWADRDDASIRMIAADVWRGQPPALKAPWSAGIANEDVDGFSPGWTVYRLESNGTTTS